MNNRETIKSKIWFEIPESDNPFSAATCYCHGYDVYGDILIKASWPEFIFLLFRGERPDASQTALMEKLAIAVANPGPRDHSVQAAMNGGVGGSSSAASLMAALAVGAGQLGGAREVFLVMEIWNQCGNDLRLWKENLVSMGNMVADVWPNMEHTPGFDPYGKACTVPVKSTLNVLSNLYPSGSLNWLRDNRQNLEKITNCPLGISGVAAAALRDLGFSPSEGEMLYLILRLPGAAVHSLEQAGYGFRHFPFYRNAVHLKEEKG